MEEMVRHLEAASSQNEPDGPLMDITGNLFVYLLLVMI